MGNKILLILVCLLMIIPLANAVPPVQVASQPAFLQIAYPKYQYVQIDGQFKLHTRVYNTSQYITGEQASCYLSLYNPDGTKTIDTLLNASSSDYFVNITKGNFSILGEHAFIIQCNSSAQSGFANGIFEVTHSGSEIKSGEITMMIVGLAVLVLFAILFMILGILINNTAVKLFFMVLSGLTLLILAGLIAANSADYLSDFRGLETVFTSYYIVFITLAGAGMIGLIVWLIYTSVTAFNKARGRVEDD